MTQITARDTVQADFQNVVLTNGVTRFVLSQESDEYWVRMERAVPPGPGELWPEPIDVRIGLVTGSHHMQVFWVPNGIGNGQIGFPFTWLIPEKRWVPRNSTFLRPPSVELRPETWNSVCLRCHATGPEPNLDRENRTWETQVGELGISCEACHGPGERHTREQMELAKLPEESRPESTDLAIVHPEELTPKRASQVCAFCHSMKWWDQSEGWPEHGFSYRPGDDLDATTPIIRPDEVEEQPWLHNVLEKNPGLLQSFFWSDGMIRVSGREYNGLIDSPCYKGGEFSCLSCHSLHKSEPADLLAWNRNDNRACTQCHEEYIQESVVTSHTHHVAESSGSECYNCHMPHTTYGVLTAIRSHEVSSPNVADQLATGRPNACNLCHLDQTLAWTGGQLAEWYGYSVPDLSAGQMAFAESVRLALTGDAGQRALIAWHLSWEPAVKVSGETWIPPILARLMDDSYAAVRCVGERSLRKISGLVPKDYDYTISPDARPTVLSSIFDPWNTNVSDASERSFSPHTLVRRNDQVAMTRVFDELAAHRDEKRVRLRE